MSENKRVKLARDEKTRDGLFPIRTVSNLTGVNSITLRAWERRYGIIAPHRTPKGHRLYTQEDIDFIHQVVELLEKGIPISQVRSYLEQASPTTHRELTKKADFWQTSEQRMINAIVRFNQDVLESVYNDALALYPVDVVTTKLILPLLTTLGDRWQAADGSVAEEHFFGSYLRNKLGARFHHQFSRRHGPKLVAACLPGEYHEVGLLLFCLSASERDYRLVLLGANMPFDELPLVVQRSECDAIVLSGSTKTSERVLEDDLPIMVENAEVPVFIGGRVSTVHHDLIVRAGAIPLGTDIPQGLRRIDDELSNPRM